jgi:hypothetical protein
MVSGLQESLSAKSSIDHDEGYTSFTPRKVFSCVILALVSIEGEA